MMNPINPPPPSKKGGLGGLLGKVVGGIAGAVAAPFTGGASIPAGLAAGSTIGGVAGELIDPVKVKETPQGPSMLDTAMKHDPSLQIGALTEAQSALRSDPSLHPDQAAEFHNYFEEVKGKLAMKNNLGRS